MEKASPSDELTEFEAEFERTIMEDDDSLLARFSRQVVPFTFLVPILQPDT